MCDLAVQCSHLDLIVFFFNDTATTEIYTLSLHDALPISMITVVEGGSGASVSRERLAALGYRLIVYPVAAFSAAVAATRSEEHTSELQSRQYLVCRLLLEKKKNQTSEDESLQNLVRCHLR